MKPVVFIHTNDKQLLGAKLSAYSLKARSKSPDKFDVRLLRLEETPQLYCREGQSYLRKRKRAVWRNADLQSFSPLRLMVPQALNFHGRALVIDPDVFAIGDVYELLARDMGDKAVVCRNMKEGYRENGVSFYATSVMLLDCSKLGHWKWDRQIDDLFSLKFDYGDWISLRSEPSNQIGELEEEWNHLDTLTSRTKLLHNTERSTQPWKTGLKVDFDTTWGNGKRNVPGESKLRQLVAQFQGILGYNYSSRPEVYREHPDPQQEVFFFRLLKDCLEHGGIAEEFLRDEVRRQHIRPDVWHQLDKVNVPTEPAGALRPSGSI